MSAALATAVVAGPAAPLAAAQVLGHQRERRGGRRVARQPRDRDPRGRPSAPGRQPGRARGGGPARASDPDRRHLRRPDRRRRAQLPAGRGPRGGRDRRPRHLGLALQEPHRERRVDRRLEHPGSGAGEERVEQVVERAGCAGPGAEQRRVRQRHRRGDRDEHGDHAVGGTTGTTTPTSTPAPTGGGSCGSSTISSPVHGTVTSPFGPRGGRNHDGMDIAAPDRTPVRAAACGTVSLAGAAERLRKHRLHYAHEPVLDLLRAPLALRVSSGTQVQQGQVIGYVGCTGSCTGPHLHFETRVGGTARDPQQYLGGATIPGASTSPASATTASRAGRPPARATRPP